VLFLITNQIEGDDAVVYHLFRNVGSLACLTQIIVPTVSVIHFVYSATVPHESATYTCTQGSFN